LRLKHYILALILLAFVLLGCVYSLVTPVFEASDEIFHYPVVKYIADGRGLPVQDPRAEAAWEQEGSQPPLYYGLAALATAWINTDDMQAVRWRNPLSNIGRPLTPGNKNLVVHTAAEAFPWHGSVLAIHLIRFLSLLLQAGTVFLTYHISRVVWPEREELASLAAALVAFNPMFLFIAGSVNNDNLITPLATWVLLLLALTLKEGWLSYRRAALLGLLLGLVALTKLSGLGLLLLAAVVLTVVAARQRAWGAWLRWGVILVGMVALIAGWWYVRNWRLYGDPTGLNVMLEIAGRRDISPSWRELLAEFEGFRMSFWGVFGGFTVVAPGWLYNLYDLLVLAGIVGWVVLAWRRRGRWQAERIGLILLLVAWILTVGLSLVRWTSQTLASQGRLLFPAIAAVAVLLATGLAGWAAERWRSRIVLGLGSGLLIIAAAIPIWVIRPAYAMPPLLDASQVPADASPADLIVGETMRLLAYELPQDTVRPGADLPVRLYWESIAPEDRDLSVFVHLFGRDMTLAGLVGSYPGLGAYPTTLLRPGQVVADTYPVPVTITATVPSLLRVQVGLFQYGVADEAPVAAFDSAGRPANGMIGTVRLLPPRPPTYQISEPVRFDLDGQALLLGYDLPAETVRPGEAVTLTLYWQAQARMSEDYHVFVHLVGPMPEEGTVAQHDKVPLDGDWPTWAWEPGYTVRDEYSLQLPVDLQPGTYQLRAGLYRLSDGQRVPVQGPDGRVKDSAMILGQVEAGS
jgi:4-amino-4-deoxy-L-arabinose transferase-like glycosyltransferase